jgi:hypothetical protein
MSFGLTTWKADGTAVITPLGAGGLFVEARVRLRAAGAGTVTYSGLNGRTLRVFQVYAGEFTWTTGVDGSGNPTLTFTLLPVTLNGGEIRLLVFAI